jgi:cytochrome oxidase Cu insertion factor (SCO1/SenC/PrrC family)
MRAPVLAAAVCLAAAAPAAADGPAADFAYAAPEPASYALPVVGRSPDGAVLDAAGRPRRLAELLRGRIGIVSLIYTRCSDARGCPLAATVLAELAELAGGDAAVAGALRLVSLSFDPAHDTPEVMALFENANGGTDGPVEWRFLTTPSPATLAPILDGFGQYVVPERDEEGRWTGGYRHMLKVFLVDAGGRIRNIYGASFLDARLVLADVRTLLAEAHPNPR